MAKTVGGMADKPYVRMRASTGYARRQYMPRPYRTGFLQLRTIYRGVVFSMSTPEYRQPPFHARYPRPYKPGPIPGTKKEWAICTVCKVLFLRRIDRVIHPRRTCGNATCANTHHANITNQKSYYDAYYRKNRDAILAKRHAKKLRDAGK